MLSLKPSRGVGRAGWIDGVRLASWLLAASSVAFGQYPGGYPGGYPPGGYPPGTYPPGYPGRTGTGIPIPSKGSTKPVNNAPMPNFRGYFKQMDDKNITIELDDHRELQFRRNGKTKFFKGGDEIKSPAFAVGDQVSVEGPQDPDGFFTAVNVYWERAADKTGGTQTAGDTRSQSAPDTWKDDAKKDAPPAKDSATPPPSTSATVVAPSAAPPDPDDPGRPVLKRGKAADPTRETAADNPAAPTPPPAYTPAPSPGPVTEAENRPPVNSGGTPSILHGDEDPVVRRPAGDPLIAKATEAALDFTEGLPNYVCQEMMARYESTTHPANWQAIDIVSAALVYENGKEDYRDIAVNGKLLKKSIDQVGGAWSTGEFGTMLIDLLSPATAAQFRYRREERQSGVITKVYDYSVKRENSHWQITMSGQTYRPAYKGSIWVDPATSRCLAHRDASCGLPGGVPHRRR